MPPPIGLIDDALNQAGLRKPPLRQRLLARLTWEWRAIIGRRGLLCRLSVRGVFAKIPLELLVEARARPIGFSVWAFNPIVCPKGMEIVRTDHAYDWRAFAHFLLEYVICTRFLHNKDPTPWGYTVVLPDLTAVAVLGERGFGAEVLRAALGERAEPAGWLLGQPADSVAAILSLHRMPFSKEDWTSVTQLTSLSYSLGCNDHFLAICRLFGDGTAMRLEVAAQAMRGVWDQLRAADAERVNMFRPQIDAIAGHFSDIRRSPYWVPSSRHLVESFLEHCVLKHGRMPEGKVKTYDYPSDLWAGASNYNWLLWQGTANSTGEAPSVTTPAASVADKSDTPR